MPWPLLNCFLEIKPVRDRTDCSLILRCRILKTLYNICLEKVIRGSSPSITWFTSFCPYVVVVVLETSSLCSKWFTLCSQWNVSLKFFILSQLRFSFFIEIRSIWLSVVIWFIGEALIKQLLFCDYFSISLLVGWDQFWAVLKKTFFRVRMKECL